MGGDERPISGARAYRLLCGLLAGRAGADEWAALAPASWEALLQTALAEGVAPLAYWHFKEHGWPTSTPASVRAALEGAYYDTAAFNALLYGELVRILDALAAAGVPVIVLKGAALAATLYPDAGLRPMGDLDLLVPRELLDEAIHTLGRLSYRGCRQERIAGFARIVDCDIKLVGGPQGRVAVELHWNLVAGDSDRRSPPVDWFWERTERRALGEGQGLEGALALRSGADLLYLAAHLALQHGTAQGHLLWYYDIHLLAQSELGPEDWDEAVEAAGHFGWAPALHAALQGTVDRFGSLLPGGVLETLAGHDDSRAAALVKRKGDPRATRSLLVWEKIRAQSWQARLLIARGALFPRAAYLRQRYALRPAWLWPLLYPVRWADLGLDGLVSLQRAVVRSRGRHS